MDTYIIGESIELSITIKNENGTIVNLDTLVTIAISVYNSTSAVVLKEGTKAGGEIVYDSTAAAGVITFCIEDELTSLASKGYYDYLLTVTQADSCFDDGIDTGKYTDNAFRLK